MFNWIIAWATAPSCACKHASRRYTVVHRELAVTSRKIKCAWETARCFVLTNTIVFVKTKQLLMRLRHIIYIPRMRTTQKYFISKVAWYSSRTLVFDQRTFAVLRLTYSWRMTTYVGKPFAIGQPTRLTQPSAFHPFWVDKWVIGCN